jgi:hypothetical protein
MNRLTRVTVFSAATSWVIVFAWPAITDVLPPLTKSTVDGLHLSVALLASSLTVSCMVPILLASHTRAFAQGMLFQLARERDGQTDSTDNKVVNLRPRRIQATGTTGELTDPGGM